jgi:GT2 family glycosyltransferase
MKPSVASVTTAYNAVRVLPRQMDALLRQSRPLQEIVVVDNGSTDGTAAMLAERYPQVTVLRLPSNVGAAGGWAAGLQYAALEKRHDWIWNFDDDSVPGETALEAMLSGSHGFSEDPTVGMLTPLPVNQTTGDSYPPLLWREGLVKPPASVLKEEVWFADAAVASGCMVRRQAAEAVGLPRADFFMDFFDFEYCLRLRAHGFRIAVVNKCQFAHELGDAKVIRFAGLRHVWSEHAPWREYYISRNVTYAALWLYPTSKTKRFLAGHLLRHALAILLFGGEKFTSVKRILQGVNDGRLGRLGIRFLPGQPDRVQI